MLAVILGVGLRLWLYNTVIVDTFYNAPAQLAAAMVGARDPVEHDRCDLGAAAAPLPAILWTKGARP